MADTRCHIALGDLADERQTTVPVIRQLCQAARIAIPKSERLAPSAWKRLDAYLYKQYKVCAGEALPASAYHA